MTAPCHHLSFAIALAHHSFLDFEAAVPKPLILLSNRSKKIILVNTVIDVLSNVNKRLRFGVVF